MNSRRKLLFSSAATMAASVAGALRPRRLLAATRSRRARLGPNTPGGHTQRRRRSRGSMEDGRKTFHLIAEPVVREFAPGLRGQLLGLQRTDARSHHRGRRRRSRPHLRGEPAPGAHLRALARRAPAERHGRRRRAQPDRAIEPGETFKYEFTVRQHGTQMYHPHFDEMVQQSMGMMGFLIFHPQEPDAPHRPRLRRSS